ncbi:FAD-dependent oxidoreductase [Variovorax sp. PCZ-1]|uniref:FAD-dependent oxidoreductase n=1 Tax=Variovorax sp. PCZ-1 TaxID=2835533 RepID=UPI001BCC8775|nr:FAD-dependent oxidoreductase [Variovorax sp. PCZ-1]MBS7806459.1 FAD-dependent oxidoreductase [Variovorax sp. PCZ-1]
MKIAVVGAGIIGITTAYELARDGHEVTVFEKRGAAAEESSFSNAGVLSPGYVTPWAAPGMPWKVLRQMASSHAAFRLNFPLSGADIAWLWRFWRACNLPAYQSHRSALQQMAFYSRSQLHAITERHGLEYDRAEGYLIALRTEKDRALVQPSLQVLRDLGVPFSELDEAGAREIEPAINTDTRFAGAIHLAQDEVANCRQFALLLKDECRRLGVQFEFNTSVQKLQIAGTHAAQSATLLVADIQPQSQLSSLLPNTHPASEAGREINFDAVVLCTGVQAASLVAKLGVHLPLRPVYGYSVSAHVKEPLNAPRSGLMDERYKVSITRLGQRVRVAGSAQVGGRAGEMNRAALKTLYKVLHDWFPGAAVMSQGVQEWQGARPMLANRPPVISRVAMGSAVWLNLGHGSSGWALSCGSARLLADQISKRQPAIDSQAYAL